MKSFTRLVGKIPIKPPDDTMDLKDVGDEVIVDDGENDIALEDEGDNNIVPDDDVEEEENITVTDGNTTRVSMDVT